jgi:hypothetical protein
VASGIPEAARAFQWENPWGIIENPWEKTWENHGKTMGKSLKSHRSLMNFLILSMAMIRE